MPDNIVKLIIQTLLGDSEQKLGALEGGLDGVTEAERRLTRAEAEQTKAAQSLARAQKALVANTDPRKQRELENAVIGARREFDKATTAVKGFDKAGQKTKMSLTDLRSGLMLVTGALKQIQRGVQQAMEIAELGAQATQTEEGFARMRAEFGLSAEYLGLLDDKARGTIPQLELMQGLTTLTAGTTKEFGGELANAYPQLLELAKAASKLNPQLGDTSYMLNSISLGIKRGSPLILDNLGLTVKLGAANKAMAAQLGKTVDQLTNEEKQMALLNDVLDVGGRLIEQVGGSTEATTDEFERMRAASDNLKISLAKLTEEAGANVAGTIAVNLEWRNAQLMADALVKEVETYDRATGELIRTQYDAIAQEHGLIVSREEQQEQIKFLREAIETLLPIQDRYNVLLGYAEAEAGEWASRLDDTNLILPKVAHGVDELTEAEKRFRSALDDEKIALHELSQDETIYYERYLKHKKEEAAAAEAQATLIEDTRARAAAATDFYRQHLEKLAAAQGDAFESALELEEQEDNVAQILYSVADAMGAGAVTMAEIAAATGDYTEAQINNALRAAAMKTAAEKVFQSIEAGRDTVETGTKRLQDFGDALDEATGEAILDIELPPSAQAAIEETDRLRRNLVEDWPEEAVIEIDDQPVLEAQTEVEILEEKLAALELEPYEPEVATDSIDYAITRAIELDRRLRAAAAAAAAVAAHAAAYPGEATADYPYQP